MTKENEIPTFDYSKLLKTGVVVAIVGTSNSGKTSLAKYLIYKTQQFYNNVYIYQKTTPSVDNSYSNCIWPSNVKVIKEDVHGVKEMVNKDFALHRGELIDIKNRIDNHNRLCLTNKIKGNVVNSLNTLYIFDDFGQDNRQFTSLFDTTRHANISCIMLLHCVVDATPRVRERIDYIFYHTGLDPLPYYKPSKATVEKYTKYKEYLSKNPRAFICCEKGFVNLSCIALTPKENELGLKNQSFIKTISGDAGAMTYCFKGLIALLKKEDEKKKNDSVVVV